MYNSGLYVILTALSPNMWDDYLVFYDSIRMLSNIRIIVVCVELKNDHVEYLKQQINVTPIIINQSEFDDYKAMGAHWRQWHKPIYINKCIDDISPDYILWIDVDAVILKPLDPIFKSMSKQFFATQDYFAPETTLNDQKLYEKYNCPVDDIAKEKISLNSGVVGLDVKRDKYILDKWCEKIEILHGDEEGREWTKLFDQGALLWALRELDLLHLIQPVIEFNYPAIKNPYELVTPSKNNDKADYIWPDENTQIGGDIINNIKIDNPDAIIAHYAGLPKISHLCKIDHDYSLTYINHKRGAASRRQRLFCVGLERCGTHTIAEMVRKSSIVENWVRHEHRPCLAKEALMKFQGDDYKTDEFKSRMELYRRQDCMLICESNHRLGFFIDDINEATDGQAKFILMIRNPIDLIKSRLCNFTMWPDYIDNYPGFYQFDYFELQHTFGSGSVDQNEYRIVHPEYLDSEIIDLHLWEISETLNYILDSLNKLSRDRYQIILLDSIQTSYTQILKLTNNTMLNHKKLKSLSKIAFGKHLDFKREQTTQWIDEYTSQHRNKIFNTICEIFRKYRVQLECDVFI